MTHPAPADLRVGPLLSRCSPRDLRRLRRAADHVRVDAGTTVSPPGTLHFFYLLLAGRAAVVSDQGTSVLGPGDGYGAIQMLTPDRQGALLVASTDVSLLAIPRRGFLGLLDTIPTFGGAVAQQLATAQAHRCRVR